MRKICSWIKSETVLVAAWLLALVSMVFVPPDEGYWEYIDVHTLLLLFSLMAVMAGFQQLGVFRRLGEVLLVRISSTRQLEGVLIFLPFFVGMIVTNDVALITFVPFALEVLKMADRENRLIPVVAMQTIAANLGSMTTPIGSPQNLYLYIHYELNIAVFFRTMLPLTVASAVLLGMFLFLTKSQPLVASEIVTGAKWDNRRLWLYILLFVLCMGVVAKIIPVWLVSGIVLAAILIWDRPILQKVDYALLFTFVGFFLFVGNLGRLPLFRKLFQQVLTGHEVLCSVLASQVISNVPTALLLSGFTEKGTALLVGTNLGGLGTLIASMASLISFKQIARNNPQQRIRYLRWFTVANLIFLIVLMGLFFCVNSNNIRKWFGMGLENPVGFGKIKGR